MGVSTTSCCSHFATIASPSIVRTRRRDGSIRRAHRVRANTGAASSTSTSAPGDDDAAVETVRAPPGSHIYFAYGSNVNTKTMSGVRGVRPSASYPAVLDRYTLVFTVPGLPYVEPGFASVRRIDVDEGVDVDENDDDDKSASDDSRVSDDDDASLARYEREVHGVAYVITDEEWRFVLRSESGYDVEAVTLRRCSDGAPIEATTLVYPETDLGLPSLLPSARYLGLLTEGAEEWNLDAGWRRYLRERVRAYAPEGKELAGAIAAASLAPIGLATAPLGLAMAARRAMGGEDSGGPMGASEDGGESEVERAANAAIVDGFRAFQGFTWGVHNALWEPVFGSGANNDEDDGQRR